MFRFLNPPAFKQELTGPGVDAKYKAMRWQVFIGAFIGYVADHAGWDWTFVLFLAGCVLSIVFMAFTYKEEQRNLSK